MIDRDLADESRRNSHAAPEDRGKRVPQDATLSFGPAAPSPFQSAINVHMAPASLLPPRRCFPSR